MAKLVHITMILMIIFQIVSSDYNKNRNFSKFCDELMNKGYLEKSTIKYKIGTYLSHGKPCVVNNKVKPKEDTTINN
ncbi:hypothetical protein U3516DRAFT_771881 [Neocallimastix sp. 'constans']